MDGEPEIQVTTSAKNPAPPPAKRHPPTVQAWLAFLLPGLSWALSWLVNQKGGSVGVQDALLVAGAQLALLLVGLALSLWVLIRHPRGKAGILFPAGAGLAVSAGTLLLIAVLLAMQFSAGPGS